MQERIIIVEDERELGELIQLYLRKEGAEAVLCASAEEGLDLYQRTKPDLIVLDRIMPHSGGTRFTMGVHGNPNRKAAILVVYSSTLRAQSDSAGGQDAAKGFSRILEIPKSVSPSDLALRVKELFFPAA